MHSRVLILNTDLASVYASIEKTFHFFKNEINERPKKVAIKLNLCSFKLPETGAISHPIVVEQLLRFLRQKYGEDIEISLVESDTATRNIDSLYEILGFKDIADKYKAKCINLSKDEIIRIRIKGYYFEWLLAPRTLVESDLFISLPKLKTHADCKITCGLKNQFGCIPYKHKAKFHRKLNDVIADVNLAFKPDLVLMDGIIGMGGPGPINGVPKNFNIMLASDDVVALDCVCAKILGFNPYFVGHIRKSSKKVGSMKYRLYGDLNPVVFHRNVEFNKTKYYLEKVLRIWTRGEWI